MADVLRDASAKLNALKEVVAKTKDGGGSTGAAAKAELAAVKVPAHSLARGPGNA